MLLRVLTLFFLVLSSSVFPGNLPEELPMSDIEGGSLCMVDGVNVITGHYSYFLDPLVVPGPESASYQCGYSTGLLWQDNFDVTLYFPLGTNTCRYYQFGTGAHFFRSDYELESNMRYRINVSHEKNIGLTNLGQGRISGKTSHRNFQISVPNKQWGDYIYLTSGTGEKKTFEKEFRAPNIAQYQLKKEQMLSGNQILYDYMFFENGEVPHCHKIDAVNTDQSLTFGSIEFKKYNETKPTLIETSDERQLGIEYTFLKSHRLPKGIGHPHLPYHQFEYLVEHFEYPLLLKIYRGQDHEIELTYWGQGRIPDYRKHNLKRGRIQKISKKLKPNSGNTNVYHFDYKIDEKDGKIKGGTTSVVDALGYKRQFTYNKDMRITQIEHTSCNGRLKYENFTWDKERLQSKDLLNAKGQTVFSKRYTYDRNGNVLREGISGSFSGTSDYLERFQKKYTYSKNKLNNVQTADDGDTITVYTYKENTDL